MEATAEWRHLTLHSGSLDKMSFPCSYEDQRPGNKGPFYCNRGIHPKIEPKPEDAPPVAIAILEALVCHNCRQTKARNHQEYQRQQDNTESPIANFPSPTLVDREEPMNLDSLEGATTAPPPFSSATLALPKKKITIQEYHRCKATEEQQVTTFLNQDENGEDLDYEDFDPQDDPANIQTLSDTDTSHADARSPATARCLDPSAPESHHPSDPRCDYSNAPRQHWPRHRSRYGDIQCYHHN